MEVCLVLHRTDFLGNQHVLTYEQLQLRYAHVPPNSLALLLQQVLQLKREQSTEPGAQGVTSLLDAGQFSMLSAAATAAPEQHMEEQGQQQQRSVPAWRRAPHIRATTAQKLSLRESGANTAANSQRVLMPPEQFAGHLNHHSTVRGHRYAVYCIAFDRRGRYIITGSDDRLVKIWSSETAMLLRSCRGHDGEVTDLAVSVDNTMVASSSNDHTVRCWNLEADVLGHPVSVLVGHTAAVTFVDFCRALPHALLSSSFDGTCRIWNAQTSAPAAIVLRASPQFGPKTAALRHVGDMAVPSVGSRLRNAASSRDASIAEEAAAAGAAAAGTAPEAPGLLVCSFSYDGDFIVAGANDCNAYVWHWDVVKRLQHRPGRPFYDPPAEEDLEDQPSSSSTAAPPALADLPPEQWPRPQELCKLQGHRNDVLLLQFSHDGEGIATGSKDGCVQLWRRRKRKGKVLNLWELHHTLACSNDEDAEAVRTARRRKRAPPTPSINQVAWSTDDSKILAAVTDHSIWVWDAFSGEVSQRLVGHAASVHILECHPTDHRLAMSASYDGLTIVWNIVTGVMLTSFSTCDTCPGGGRWVDPIQLVDGHWAPDGSSLAVSDVAGQWHLYGVGSGDLAQWARYDQFFASDYGRLIQDANRWVIDEDTQLPPHLRTTRDALVDYVGDPYVEPYQSAFQERRVALLPLHTAQGWEDPDRLGGRLPHALITEPPTLTSAFWQAQEAGGSEAAVQQAVQRAAERAQQAADALAQGLPTPAPQHPPQPRPQQASRQAPARAQSQGTGAAAARQAQAVRQPAAQRQQIIELAAARREALRAASEPGESGEEEAESESDLSESSSESGDEQQRRRRDNAIERDGEGYALRGRTRASGSSRPPKRSRDARSSRLSSRKRARRQYADEFVSGDESESESDLDDLEEEEEQQDSRLRRSHRRAAARARRALSPQDRKGKGPKGSRHRGSKNRKHQKQDQAAGGGRPEVAYSWLQGWKQNPGTYIPQQGDEVVYLQEGHAKYLELIKDKQQGPWETLVGTADGGQELHMRPAEPARVVSLHYIISDIPDLHQATTVRMHLILTDPASPLSGREFTVDLPPPSFGAAEFVVLRARFDAAIERCWKAGDRCQVFYTDEHDGQWWTGVIIEDMRDGRPADEVLRDPYGCGGLWERFTVVWDQETVDEPGPSSAGESQNIQQLSPWELFDEGVATAEAVAEGSHLDEAIVLRTLAMVEQLSRDPRFGEFVETVPAGACWPTEDDVVYYNVDIALPFSLANMRDRLEERYYRQPEALEHDARLIAINAGRFNGAESEVALEAHELSRRIIAAKEGRLLEEQNPSPAIAAFTSERPRRPSRLHAASAADHDRVGDGGAGSSQAPDAETGAGTPGFGSRRTARARVPTSGLLGDGPNQLAGSREGSTDGDLPGSPAGGAAPGSARRIHCSRSSVAHAASTAPDEAAQGSGRRGLRSRPAVSYADMADPHDELRATPASGQQSQCTQSHEHANQQHTYEDQPELNEAGDAHLHPSSVQAASAELASSEGAEEGGQAPKSKRLLGGLKPAGRTRPTNNQLLYKAYFRWSHYPHKLLEGPTLPLETEACASVTSAFLQVLSVLYNVETGRLSEPRNILQLLSINTRRTKVVELSSGTHRVPDELRRHSLSDGKGGQYSTNLDRNRYGTDDQYLSTVIRYDLDFLDMCPCLVDVEIIDAKNGSGTVLVSADEGLCTCGGKPSQKQLKSHKAERVENAARASSASGGWNQRGAAASGESGLSSRAEQEALGAQAGSAGNDLFDALLMAATVDAAPAAAARSAGEPATSGRAHLTTTRQRSRIWALNASAAESGDQQRLAEEEAGSGHLGTESVLRRAQVTKHVRPRSTLARRASTQSVRETSIMGMPLPKSNGSAFAPLPGDSRAGGLADLCSQEVAGNGHSEGLPASNAAIGSRPGAFRVVQRTGSAGQLSSLGRASDDAELRRLQQEVSQMKVEAASWQSQLAELSAKEAAARSQAGALQDELNLQQIHVAQYVAQITALKAEVQRLGAAHREADARAVAQQAAAERAQQELATLKSSHTAHPAADAGSRPASATASLTEHALTEDGQPGHSTASAATVEAKAEAMWQMPIKSLVSHVEVPWELGADLLCPPGPTVQAWNAMTATPSTS
ncbi:hypothetical protein WJX72_005590 [[Myrmecia] bisecta]|uniref:Bromo domain-containing protein n=1 Tax=[Myrmecia] bisecta TaxID=41462 RepID=A0AAW1R6I1_9CHLO